MSKQEDKTMKEVIIGWGLPDCLKQDEDNIAYKFDEWKI
ncbi:hypothetical protein ABIE66_001763 [Peribacillus sp. B2I2]